MQSICCGPLGPGMRKTHWAAMTTGPEPSTSCTIYCVCTWSKAAAAASARTAAVTWMRCDGGHTETAPWVACQTACHLHHGIAAASATASGGV